MQISCLHSSSIPSSASIFPILGCKACVLRYIWIIFALLVEQLTMAAAFHNLAMVHYNDKVRITDGRKPVCNDDDCPVFHDPLHGVLNGFFRSGVHIGGCFVQNQNLRFGYKGAGNGKQLTLPLTDFSPAPVKTVSYPCGSFCSISSQQLISIACCICASVAFSLPYFRFCRMVSENSTVSCKTIAIFFRRFSREISLIFWLLMRISPLSIS